MRTPLCLLLMLAVLSDCACRKTDAQRAREEREAIEKKLRNSLTLFPYRLVKLSLRSRNSPNRPKAVDTVAKVLDQTRALPQEVTTAAEAASVAKVYGELLVALFAARESMKDRDEDEFPTLMTTAFSVMPPISPYGNAEEHLLLAAIFFVIDEADQSNQLPGETEIVFYELSRATPQPNWPVDATQTALLLRGGAFHAAGSHYAAEEELTTSIALLDDPDAGWSGGEGWREQLRVCAHFIRAMNRQKLGRDEGVTEDMEAMLTSTQRLGLDNELTWWAQAMVSSRRGRFEQAADAIEKLAVSSNLDASSQAAMHDAATSMRKTGTGLPVLLQAQASAILVRALLARAGGFEGVMAMVVGAEKAHELASPLHWLDRTRKQLVNTTPDLNPVEFVKARWRDGGHLWP